MPPDHRRAPLWGLLAAVVLVVLAYLVPTLTGWGVHARSDAAGGISVPPLHGTWQPKLFGPGTLPAVVLGVLGAAYGLDLAARLAWRRLLLLSYVVGLGWMVSLATTDGWAGISHVLAHPYEYGATARNTDDVSALLHGWVPRISADSPDRFVTHVAGHPPLALLFFVGLARIGLGSDLAMGLAVIVVAAAAAPAVLVTLRRLGAEDLARRAAPFLVLGPAALFMAVSADAVFGAVAAWGLAALACAASAVGWGRIASWSVVAGLLLGACVLLSYGLPLLGLLALAVLAVARSWRPLPITALAALAVVLGFALAGFSWWEAFPAIHDRYWRGLAKERPFAYWAWGDLAALVVSAGPILGAGLGQLVSLGRRAARPVLWLTGSTVVTIVLADVSRMSKAEVERIWLPFVPWLLLSTALLPERWRRAGLVLQVAVAILVEQLLFTDW